MQSIDEQPPRRLRNIPPGRSCIACKRRKIRCDRGQPWGYCTKLKSPCRYPDLEQSENKSSSSSERDVLTRLRRIETLLARLQDSSHQLAPEQNTDSNGAPTARLKQGSDRQESSLDSLSPSSGKLLVQKTEARFVSGSFWTSLDEESNGETSDAPEYANSESVDELDSHAFEADSILFASDDPERSYAHHHPPGNQVFALWQLFLDRVDPLLKLVHVPMTQRQIIQAGSFLTAVDPAFESLMFAIYYAAASSTQNDLLDKWHRNALSRYRTGLHKALIRANFLSKPDFVSLQALTLYLICARQGVDRTYIWSMVGVAIRLATRLGLHQDPSALGLAPFVAEMRRRLWWQIVILDVLTAEENDMDPALLESSFDTQMPSNVNDQDLDIAMTAPVTSTDRRTEMMFALQRIEISYAARKVLFSAKFTADNGYESRSEEGKNQFLDDLHKELAAKYYHYCDLNIPLCGLTTTSGRVVLSRMRLMINSKRRSEVSSFSAPELMSNCIDIVEQIQHLRAHEIYQKWTWLFQRYVEWDAVAFLLDILSKWRCEDPDKVWALIREFWASWKHKVPLGSIRRRWHRLESLKKKAEGAGKNMAYPEKAPSHLPSMHILRSFRTLLKRDRALGLLATKEKM